MRKPTNTHTDLSAPLPLGYTKAVERAVRLRELGPEMTWATIALVIREYHGFDRGAAWWRSELRGRVPARSRGNAFGPDRREAARAA